MYLCAVAHVDILCDPTHIDNLRATAHKSKMTGLARTPRQIGAIIQRSRKKRGWTQTDLAERAGLRQETISKIETGEKPAKLSSILSVMAALDLDLRVVGRAKGSASDIEELF